MGGLEVTGGSVPVKALKGGESVKLSYNIGKFSSAGSYSTMVGVDPENLIEETDENNNHKKTSFTVVSKPVTPEPDAPGNLTVTVKNYDATVIWNKVTAAKGIKVSYEVWIDGKTVAVKSNKFTLKNASVGTYTFAVRTVFSDGTVSNWSSTVTQKVVDVTAPKTGALTVSQSASDAVRLFWTAATDNVGIDHYVVTCGSKSQKLAGNILSAEFSGVAGKVDATITAYDAAGNASKTVKKSLKIKDVTAPTTVTGLKSDGVDNKSGGILVWNKATDNVGVTQYLVKVDDKTYKSKTNSLKIKKLNAGDHKFTVIAVDKEKNQSIMSEECKFTVTDVIDPKVTKLAAKVGKDDSAKITWEAFDETKLDRVEYTLSLDGKDIIEDQEHSKKGFFEFDTLSAGNYTLRMTAYDMAGNDSIEKKISFKIKGILASK